MIEDSVLWTGARGQGIMLPSNHHYQIGNRQTACNFFINMHRCFKCFYRALIWSNLPLNIKALWDCQWSVKRRNKIILQPRDDVVIGGSRSDHALGRGIFLHFILVLNVLLSWEGRTKLVSLKVWLYLILGNILIPFIWRVTLYSLHLPTLENSL